jgi:hypothetical protein
MTLTSPIVIHISPALLPSTLVAPSPPAHPRACTTPTTPLWSCNHPCYARTTLTSPDAVHASQTSSSSSNLTFLVCVVIPSHTTPQPRASSFASSRLDRCHRPHYTIISTLSGLTVIPKPPQPHPPSFALASPSPHCHPYCPRASIKWHYDTSKPNVLLLENPSANNIQLIIKKVKVFFCKITTMFGRKDGTLLCILSVP